MPSAITGALGGAVTIYFAFDHVSSRVNKFLTADAGDAHQSASQVARAQEAIAAGGLWGRGPGEGVMKRNVPDLHTDFARARWEKCSHLTKNGWNARVLITS